MVYYVEDDTNIRELALYALRQSGIEAKGFAQDAEFWRACAQQIPDVILLDIMLPGIDGLQILRRLRITPGISEVPVMMLTARDTELDTVRALDDGADDYLAKPFGMLEMVSRVRALLRRSRKQLKKGVEEEILTAGPLVVRPARREAEVAGAALDLTMREFDLLAFLVADPGVVFSREELLRRVWGWEFDGGSRTVDVHVRQLRSKLCDHAALIQTIRGVGYRLSPDEDMTKDTEMMSAKSSLEMPSEHSSTQSVGAKKAKKKRKTKKKKVHEKDSA